MSDQPARAHLDENNHLNETVPAADHQHSQGASHVHSAASQKRIVNRLSRIEGHVRGIKSMVQEDRPCPDVLTQIAAVRGALDGVARFVLDEHLSECITRAADEGSIEAEVKALKAALDRFI
ncbi:MAG: metal-sensitive transcriptional regulator [Phormidesmis sp.]